MLVSRNNTHDGIEGDLLRKRGIVVIALTVAVLVILAAYVYFRNEQSGLWRKSSDELMAVSELKAGGISDWYVDELHDIEILAGNELLLNLVENWEGSGSSELRAVLNKQLRALKSEHGYQDLFLCRTDGTRYHVDSDSLGETNFRLSAFLPGAIKSKTGICTDIYACPHHGGLHLDFAAAMKTPTNKQQLILVGRFDPEEVIFRFIQQWPTASPSAESYLARQEVGTVIILNNLRHVPHSALDIVYPLTDTTRAVVKAVLGFTGIMRATDYQGKEVIAYAAPVPNTPWFIVTKKDVDEVFEGLYFESGMLAASLLLIVVTVVLGISYFYSSRQSRVYRDLWNIEQEFSATWYGITDAIVTTNADGRIKHVNPAALRLAGRDESLIRGKMFSDIFQFYSEGTGERTADPIRGTVEGRERSGLSGGVLLAAHDAGYIPVLGSASVLRHEDGTVFGVVVVFRDQTEVRARQRQIEESEQQYRSMFEDHAAVKMLIDSTTGAIVDANHAAAEYYGWSREELKSMKIQQINILPTDKVEQSIHRTISERRAHWEFQHRLADGSIRDVEVFAGALQNQGRELIYSILHDVTEQKRAERRIKLLGRSIEQSPVSVVITNPQGDIEYVNPQFSKVSGYSAEEVLGRNPRVLGSGLHSNAFYADLWSTILAGREWAGEFRNRHKNGEFFWEQAIISPVMDDSGTISHFIGIKTDITPEKKLMSELVTAKEKAEESDKLKSAFLANMSHEIRTPMNTIIGFSDLLSNPDLSPDDRADFTTVIRQRSYDLLNIINDILDISLIEAGEVRIVEEECSIGEILQDLLVTFNHHSKRDKAGKVELQCVNELTGDENNVRIDAARLRQVLTNLLSNAFKFTQAGNITFGCRRSNENELLFFVADSGIGIDPQAASFIFDRFRQFDDSSSRRYGGTGLGLAISQGIVDLLGGRIWVESEPEKGSTFQFSIPWKRVG